MKKRFLLSVAFFGAAAAVNSSALAAPPMYNWTGCYVGLNAGYSWGRTSVDGNATGLATLGLPTAFSTTLNPDGFIGGGQVGCNWQNSNAVWGLETDFQGSAQKDSRISSAPFNIDEGPSGNVSQNVEARLRWFGTVRARAGVLVVPTVLLYGTGGLAYGNVKVTDTITVTNGLPVQHLAHRRHGLVGRWVSASRVSYQTHLRGPGRLNTSTSISDRSTEALQTRLVGSSVGARG